MTEQVKHSNIPEGWFRIPEFRRVETGRKVEIVKKETILTGPEVIGSEPEYTYEKTGRSIFVNPNNLDEAIVDPNSVLFEDR